MSIALKVLNMLINNSINTNEDIRCILVNYYNLGKLTDSDYNTYNEILNFR